MALILYWFPDTNMVSTTRFNLKPAFVSALRGVTSLLIVALQGSPVTPVPPPAGTTAVSITVRLLDKLKTGRLAGPSPLAYGSGTTGYTGTTSSDTTLTRADLHVDPVDTMAESTSYPVQAALSYQPADSSRMRESQPFNWTITSSWLRPLKSPAAVVELYFDPLVAQAMVQSAASMATRTLLVDGATGNDTMAVRGTEQPYATLAAAIASAQDGDTIQLSAGSHALPPATITSAHKVRITGAGVGQTTLVPSASASPAIRFTVPVYLEHVNFDSRGTATNGNTNLLDISHLSGVVIDHCRFHGINGVCINGYSTQKSTFSNLDFSQTFLPVYLQSQAGNYPGGLRFLNCHSVQSLSDGFKIHSPDGYNDSLAGGPYVQGYSNDLEFIGCSATLAGYAGGTANGAGLAFEVWHGWSSVRFVGCHAEDSGYGFSFALCDRVTLTGCTARNCGYPYEFAGGHDLTATGCVAEGMPLPTSPVFAGGPHGAVICEDTPDHVSWLGGVLSNVVFHAQGANFVDVQGTQFRGAGVVAQGSSHVHVTGCTFSPNETGATAYNWLEIDGSNTAITDLVFSHNRGYGGTPSGGIRLHGGGSLAGFEVKNNHVDGTYNNGGGYLCNQGVTVTDSHYLGNVTDFAHPVYWFNTNFPNDNDVFTTAINTVGSGANNPNALEFPATTGLAVGTFKVFLDTTGQMQTWVLTAGATATDATHQQPCDFNAATNAKVWQRLNLPVSVDYRAGAFTAVPGQTYLVESSAASLGITVPATPPDGSVITLVPVAFAGSFYLGGTYTVGTGEPEFTPFAVPYSATALALRYTTAGGWTASTPGKDARFGRQVTGLVKRAGAPGTDTAAVPDVDYVAFGGHATVGGILCVSPSAHGTGAGTIQYVVPGPGQSIRRNLTTGLFEAYTPSTVVYPDADPHVAGAGYWNNGVLTRSNG